MTLLTSMIERPLDPGYAAAAERRERAGLHVLPADHRGHEHRVDVPGDQIVDCRRASAERNMQHPNAGFRGEEFAGQVARAADSDRGV